MRALATTKKAFFLAAVFLAAAIVVSVLYIGGGAEEVESQTTSGPTCLNVKDYGATPNVSTDDDGPKFQAAVDALPTTSGKICVPKGIYHFKTGVASESKMPQFEGEGPLTYWESESSLKGSSIVADASGITLFSFRPASTGVSQIGPQFSNINFAERTSTTNQTATALKIRMTNRYQVENATFDQFRYGIYIDNGSASATTGDASWGYFSFLTFNRNLNGIYEPFSGGFELHGSSFILKTVDQTGVYLGSDSQRRIHDNKFDGPGKCIDSAGIADLIHHNQLEGCAPFAIRLRQDAAISSPTGDKNVIGPNYCNGKKGGVCVQVDSGADENVILPHQVYSTAAGKKYVINGANNRIVDSTAVSAGYTE